MCEKTQYWREFIKQNHVVKVVFIDNAMFEKIFKQGFPTYVSAFNEETTFIN